MMDLSEERGMVTGDWLWLCNVGGGGPRQGTSGEEQARV